MKPVCGHLEIAATFLIGVCALLRAVVRLFVHPCVRIGIFNVKGQICLKLIIKYCLNWIVKPQY